jgi:hypothetical protein
MWVEIINALSCLILKLDCLKDKSLVAHVIRLSVSDAIMEIEAFAFNIEFIIEG